MITDLKTFLSEQLKKKLPGKKAHLELAPYRKIDFNATDIKNAKKSSVLILFYLKQNEIYTILIQRNIYNGKHSGQISFPGGKQEKTDFDSFYTALREANEEIGIIKDDIEIIGKLSNVYIPVSNFYVTPTLGFINYTPKFIPDKREVKELIELPILEILKEKNLQKTKIKLHNNAFIKTPAFVINNRIIWGATALMLNELKHLLLSYNKFSIA